MLFFKFVNKIKRCEQKKNDTIVFFYNFSGEKSFRLFATPAEGMPSSIITNLCACSLNNNEHCIQCDFRQN